MNNLENTQYIDRLYDEFTTARQALMTEMKNDKECTKEKVINAKLACVDNVLKSLLKYRNVVIKEKLKGDL